jgi:cell division protein FtsB
MKNSRKLFFYSEENVSFVEARGFKAKFSLLVIVFVFVALGAIFGANHYLGDVLGIDLDRVNFLSTENKLLKAEVKTLSARLTDMSQTMDKLSERENQLRLAVNLPHIDQDTRVIGTGGTKRETNIGIISKDASDIISSADQLLDKLDKEVVFQQQSYQDIYNKSLIFLRSNRWPVISIIMISACVFTRSWGLFGCMKASISQTTWGPLCMPRETALSSLPGVLAEGTE